MPSLSDKLFKESVMQAIRGSYLGVDIGTVAIKVVEMNMKQGKLNIVNYGMIESPDYLERINGVIQTSTLSIMNGDASKMLKTIISQMKVKTKEAVATIPSFAAFTTIIDMPIMSAEETVKAIPYQAQSIVPLAISDMTIDWIPVAEFEDEDGIKKQRIFLVAIPNDQIIAYKSVFKKAGLNLRALELDSLSMVRSITNEMRDNILIFDIGAFTTTIAITSGSILKFSFQTDFASHSLTQSLTKGLGINIKRAENLKRHKGLLGVSGEYGLSTLMFPFIDVILNEGKKAKDIFEKTSNKISKIILSGGGGEMPGLINYIENQFDLPVEKANPWFIISHSAEHAPILRSVGPRFALAVGASMKLLI